jgi:opacity protein-like surface antigen
MKKLFIAALIMVAAGTSAFAADVKVNNKVKTILKHCLQVQRM